MGHQIRKLMEQGGDIFSGTIEVDETFYSKGGNHKNAYKNKKAVIGIVERQGRIHAKVLPNRRAEVVLPVVKEKVGRGSHIVTDEYNAYDRLQHSSYGYQHSKVKHGKGHYSWKGQNTNTIEGFWGQFKRSVRGTYHFVSQKHLQAYVDEFAFRYNQRVSSVLCFQTLVSRAVGR
jgi:transposase